MHAKEGGGWTGKRILLGIGIGCGALILLMVIVAVSVGWWMYMPGQQVATTLILDRDSVAVFRLENLGKDPGVESMLRTVFKEARNVQKEQAKDLPPFARWGVSMQQGYSDRDVDRLLGWLPREVTVTLETTPESDKPEPVFAINLARFPRLIRFMVSMAARGDRANDKPQDFELGFVENTLVAASPQTLARTLERMNDPEERTQVDPELLGAFESVDPRWDFHGVLLNRGNLLDEWLREEATTAEEPPAAEAPSLEGIDKVVFGVDLVSDDEAAGEVVLDCRDEAQARQLLDNLAREVETQLKEVGLSPETSIERSDRLVILRVRVTNLRQAIIDALNESTQKAREEIERQVEEEKQ